MQRVADLYETKTSAILQRYGPGPRVHYHTGFVDNPKPLATAAGLRSQLVESQERMLKYACDSWQLRRIEFRDLLDVGCGLGGSAIFWAQEFGARVTAITIAPSHVELVAGFARLAGVESRVTPLLCDASMVPGEGCFDAAIAIESSSLFPRRPWFRCLARLLRPAGRVFISDCFVERSEYEEPFNRHWCGHTGPLLHGCFKENATPFDLFFCIALHLLYFLLRFLQNVLVFHSSFGDDALRFFHRRLKSLMTHHLANFFYFILPRLYSFHPISHLH